MNVWFVIGFFIATAGWAQPHTPQQQSVDQGGTGQCGSSTQMPACAESIPAELREEMDKAQRQGEACQQDIDRFCEGVQVGERRIEDCLRRHKKRISKKCRAAYEWK